MKKYQPTTPARRHMEYVPTKALTKKSPEKSLSFGRFRHVGRSNQGRITTRHKGGGVKRLWRNVDFKYEKRNMPAEVLALEYDPNRSGFIALVRYQDGERRYVLAPQELKRGAMISVSETGAFIPGNRTRIGRIPIGTPIYNIELEPERGAVLVRSAGSAAIVMAQEGARTTLKMPSGEIRMIDSSVWASIGSVSNPEHGLMTVGKAGRSRKMGIRPTVRGTAMNPRDHPYGGGEGRQLRGTKRPKTAWGKITGGVKTRRKNARSNYLIVSRGK